MNIANVGRQVAEELRANAEVAVISITDPSQAPAALQPGWRAVLRLAFHDIDAVVFGNPGLLERYPPMTAAQAALIATFVEAFKDSHILVHCEAGISRSYAIARAVVDTGTHEYAGTGGIPNAHVYRLTHTAIIAHTNKAAM